MTPNWQGLWSGPPCPYRRVFIDLPVSVRRTLWDYGFSRIQADGEVLADFVQDDDMRQDLLGYWNLDAFSLLPKLRTLSPP